MKENKPLKSQLKLANQYIAELESSLEKAKTLIQSQEQLIQYFLNQDNSKL